MTMTLKECAAPDVRSGLPPHPPFCTPASCTPDDYGDFHRATGFTLTGPGGAEFKVCAARADCRADYEMLGELGTAFVELSVDTRTLWSDRWALPDDDTPSMIGQDLTHDEALRLGCALMHHAGEAKRGRRVNSVGRICTEGGDEFTVYGSRFTTGQRFVTLTFTVRNAWSAEGGVPTDAGDGVVGLNFTESDAHSVGEALVAEAATARTGVVVPRLRSPFTGAANCP